MGDPAYYRYWGKTGERDGVKTWHLAAHHGWDAGAVAQVWLEDDSALRSAFVRLAREDITQEVASWVSFFVAVHDLGKLDVRFQRKALDLALRLDPKFASASDVGAYDHAAGTDKYLRRILMDAGCDFGEFADDLVAAVASHHGAHPHCEILPAPADPAVLEQDREARADYVATCGELFLRHGFADQTAPRVAFLLRGFCSVCDWIASNERYFDYVPEPTESPGEYLDSARAKARHALSETGVFRRISCTGRWDELFAEKKPMGIQKDLEEWAAEPGLIVVEAPTGCGKTEAALCHAARLVAAGHADGILFALPTQATANAMYDRLLVTAHRLFGGGRRDAGTRKGLAESGFSRGSSRRRGMAGREPEAHLPCANRRMHH